jgi:hypothetical protein
MSKWNAALCSRLHKDTDTTAFITWFSECLRLLRNVKQNSRICVKKLGKYLMVRLSLQDINKWLMWQSCLSLVFLCMSSIVKILTDVFLLLWGWSVSPLPCSAVVPFSPNLYCFGGHILSVAVSIYTLCLFFSFIVSACGADSFFAS